jgi:FkbM family methyltransferase
MKKIINQFFRLFGYKISNLKFIYDTNANLIKSIKSRAINTIIDVGANEGQFVIKLISNGFIGNVISFEPLSSAHNKLLKMKKKFINKVNWVVENRVAIGSKDIDSIINISSNSESSSILKILPSHTNLKPNSVTIGNEFVEIRKLDNYMNLITQYRKSYLLKIDTQGYEMEVLKGSSKILDIIDSLLIEVSLIELYEGQELFIDILEFLKKKNFKIWSLDRVMGDKNTGQTYQLDIFFVKDAVSDHI